MRFLKTKIGEIWQKHEKLIGGPIKKPRRDLFHAQHAWRRSWRGFLGCLLVYFSWFSCYKRAECARLRIGAERRNWRYRMFIFEGKTMPNRSQKALPKSQPKRVPASEPEIGKKAATG